MPPPPAPWSPLVCLHIPAMKVVGRTPLGTLWVPRPSLRPLWKSSNQSDCHRNGGHHHCSPRHGLGPSQMLALSLQPLWDPLLWGQGRSPLTRDTQTRSESRVTERHSTLGWKNGCLRSRWESGPTWGYPDPEVAHCRLWKLSLSTKAHASPAPSTHASTWLAQGIRSSR